MEKRTHSRTVLKGEHINRLEWKRDKTNINEEILPITRIDGRKNQWIVSAINTTAIFGKLKTRKKLIHKSKIIKIEHYVYVKDKSIFLKIKKCNRNSCDKGTWEGESCVIEIEKEKALIIKGKKIKTTDVMGKEIITIEQKKNNIVKEMENLLNDKEEDKTIKLEPLIVISDEKERKLIIEELIEGKEKIDELFKIYKDNALSKNREFHIYTDGSLVKNIKGKSMGLGWLRVEHVNSENIINQFNAANIG